MRYIPECYIAQRRNYDMQDGYMENRPRRRRRRKRINWTGIFFWLVVLMAVIAVIVLLASDKQSERNKAIDIVQKTSANRRPNIPFQLAPKH